MTTIYVSDDSREVLEYDGTSGQMLRRYTHGRGLDEALNQIAPTGQRSILVPDVQGSTVATVDSATGAVIAAGYKPFGETADTTGSFRYTGRRIDDETLGLYYYRARMYAPALGRFLQPDPIGYAGGNNLYAYVGNDPLNNVDPSGLLAGQIGSGTWSLVKSGVVVPGGGAYLQASAEFQQGNYGSAALQFGRGLVEAALALATLGDGQLLLQGGRAAAEDGGLLTGYHATSPEAAQSILQNGFRLGTQPGRLGSGGVYVNDTIEGAIGEFQYHNPGVDPTVLGVQYNPGINASAGVPPVNYVTELPLDVDSISAPSVRVPGTINTNVINGSAVPTGIVP